MRTVPVLNKRRTLNVERRTKKGFTLVEVIVSVGILSFGLILIIQGFSLALNAIDISKYNLRASLLADEVITHFLIESQTEAELGYDFSGQAETAAEYSWGTETRQDDEREELKEIFSTVAWTSGRRSGRIRLSSYLAVLPDEEEKE